MNTQRVLILCTRNSARSQLAEAILRQSAKFEAHSAGVAPTAVKPEVYEVLEESGIPSGGLWSKSVDEFAGQEFDFVITVCDNANQHCPIFPGKAVRIHWSIDDPAEVKGEQRLKAFRDTRDKLIHEFLEFANRRN